MPMRRGTRHDRLGFSVGDYAHQTAQRIAAPRQARADRSDRNADYLRCSLVAHAFQTDEQNDHALLLRQFGERAVKVAQFEALALVGGAAQRRLGLAHFDRGALAYAAANLVDMLVMKDRE